MTNREAYAHGLLNRALDPATQPDAIRGFLREEEALLSRLVPNDSRIVDFGCGTGRHLLELGRRISLGVGLDYEPTYVAEARRLGTVDSIHFLVADAAAAPLAPELCLGSERLVSVGGASPHGAYPSTPGRMSQLADTPVVRRKREPCVRDARHVG